MSAEIDIDLEAFAGADPILVIAEEVFAAMVDGEPGLLRPWDGERPDLDRPRYAWVDVHGPTSGRVLLETDGGTAESLTRALLAMGDDEPVEPADLVDALGEVANVVGGNVKSLVPEHSDLSLPTVSADRPSTDPTTLLHELALDWQGRLLVLSLWRLP